MAVAFSDDDHSGIRRSRLGTRKAMTAWSTTIA
jgi:hypothetical protein